jgi:hypothetical protein
MLDLFMIYQFIRRLVTPFDEWEAYKLGIIDERGNILKKRRELRRKEERDAFGIYDVLVLNLKKLLERLPAGQTRIASYAAALWLIREYKVFTPDSILTEDITDEQISKSTDLFINSYTDYTTLSESVKQKKHDLNDLFEEKFVDEDAPTVSVGAGAVAGLTKDDLPGLTRAQQRRHRKRAKKGLNMLNRLKEQKLKPHPKADKGAKHHVVDKSTGKVLASFKMKDLATRHHFVQQGWAEIVSDK